MKKIIYAALTLILTFSMASAELYGQQSVMLKYNFKEGKNFRSKMTASTEIVQSVMGQEMKVVSDVNGTTEMKFTKVDQQGNGTSLISIIQLDTKMQMMGQEKTDSKNDFKRDNICAVFTPSGKTLSSKILDTTAIGQALSTFNNIIKLQTLPGKQIKIGDKWDDKQTDTLKNAEGSPVTFMITTSSNEYTLVGKEQKNGKDVYKISYTGKLDIAGKGNQMGMDLSMEGTGNTAGYMLFDPSVSMIVYVDGKVEMNTNIAVTGQQNMTIPMTQSVKIISTTEEI